MLNTKQIDCIELLVTSGKNKTQVAKELGIERKTLYRWMEKEEFVRELERRTRCYKISMAKEVDRKLMSNVDMAIDVLVDLLKNSDNAETKRKIAMEIVERTAGKVPDRIETTLIEENKDSDIISKLYNNSSDSIEEDVEEVV